MRGGRDNRGGFFSSLFRLILACAVVVGGFYLIKSTIGFSALGDKTSSLLGSGMNKVDNALDSIPSESSTPTRPPREYESHNQQSLDYLKSHIASRGDMKGYDPHAFSKTGYSSNAVKSGWKYPNPNCTIAQVAIIESSKTDPGSSSCTPTSPVRTDGITGTPIANPKDATVTGIVPLPESWVSGAAKLSQADREALFTDKSNVVVTAAADRKWKPIDQWRPPTGACDYADRYAYVKSTHKLTATQSEIDALVDIWKGCS